MKTPLLAMLASALAAPLAAFGHEGHGLPAGVHWHATDTAGFVLLVVVAAALAWWTRRK